MPIKKIRLFLASSEELASERQQTAHMISRLNNKWTEQGIYLQLVIWEDLLHSFRGAEGIQDYFNREMFRQSYFLTPSSKPTVYFFFWTAWMKLGTRKYAVG